MPVTWYDYQLEIELAHVFSVCEVTIMKKEIHPSIKPVTVTCACGHVFEALSVRDAIQVEICSSCHPFFTGKKRVVDTAGRIERFRKRAEASSAGYGQKAKPKKAAPKKVRAQDKDL